MTASGIGQWSLDIASGRLVASDVFRALLHGADDDHLTETHLLEAVHPEDRAVFIDCLSSSVESGRPFQLIHRVVTDDQAARTVDTRGLIIVDDAGHPLRLAAVMVEVDEPYRR